jgi:hypothetical protein
LGKQNSELFWSGKVKVVCGLGATAKIHRPAAIALMLNYGLLSPDSQHMNDFIFYFKIGWEHIISPTAIDHIFFIAALAAVYMLKNLRQVLILVTAFTVGHAITLFLSAKGSIEVDATLVEFLIPCTIVVTSLCNLFSKIWYANPCM